MPDYKTYPLGIDVSFWQGNIDWDRVAARARFVSIKAGQNLEPDARFAQNWQGSMGKLPRNGYWFYDWRPTGASAEAQADKMDATVQPVGELPPMMDFENPYGGWSPTPFPNRATALDLIKRFRDILDTGRMILYMNSSTLRTLLPFPSWLTDEVDLHIAAYPLVNIGGSWVQPKSPADIPDNWIPATYGWPPKFWQFTSKMDGTLYGVGSKDLDGDLFMGTEDEFYKYVGVTGAISDAEKLRRLVDAHPELFPELHD